MCIQIIYHIHIRYITYIYESNYYNIDFEKNKFGCTV